MRDEITARLQKMATTLNAAHVNLTLPDCVLRASQLLIEARDRIEELEDEKRQRQSEDGQ